MFIIHPDNFERLEQFKIVSSDDFKKAKTEFRDKDELLFSIKRTPTVSLYIVAAKNFDGAKELVDKLANLKSGFDGAMNLEIQPAHEGK